MGALRYINQLLHHEPQGKCVVDVNATRAVAFRPSLVGPREHRHLTLEIIPAPDVALCLWAPGRKDLPLRKTASIRLGPVLRLERTDSLVSQTRQTLLLHLRVESGAFSTLGRPEAGVPLLFGQGEHPSCSGCALGCVGRTGRTPEGGARGADGGAVSSDRTEAPSHTGCCTEVPEASVRLPRKSAASRCSRDATSCNVGPAAAAGRGSVGHSFSLAGGEG